MKESLSELELKRSFEQTNRSHTLDTYAQKFFDPEIGNPQEEFFEWIDSSVNSNFCDLGCGEGKALSEIRKRHHNSWGVEKYPSCPLPDYIYEADFSFLPFPDNFLGSAVSVAALGCYAENEDQVREYFGELQRVLSPGGRVLLSPFSSMQKLAGEETEFCVQKPSLGNLGAPDKTNTFSCKLLLVAREVGFETKIMRAYKNYYITGFELRVN